KGAKVVVITHQGRKGEGDFTSLEQHAKLLNKFAKIKFVDEPIGEKARKAIQGLKEGEAILLENIRGVDDEFKPEKGEENEIVKFFVPLVNVYVNDSFSVCHREQASITLLPKFLPSFAGRLLEKEVSALKRIKMGECLYILGGAKPEDNLKLLRGNKVLACGLFGQLCLIAKGKKLGAQDKYLQEQIKGFYKVVEELKGKLKNVEIPVDFAVKKNGNREEILLENFPSEYEIFDIGKRTMAKYAKQIKKAKSIYMKGPAGFCADAQFSNGTLTILKAVSESKGFTLIGGGHLSDAIEVSKIPKEKFGHISLSGGALLSYVAGEKLPGLEALQ
ncbi:phosphoglycerate kinase, partial [Candidatus Pacearchaeota archaeon RBG_13_36_9]